MNTDQLIRRLVAELPVGQAVACGVPPRTWPLSIRLAVATGVSAAFVLMIILFGLSRSPPLQQGLTPTITISLFASFALAISAFTLATVFARPESTAPALRYLWPAPAILAAGVAIELAVTPASVWSQHLIGHDPVGCFTLVAVLSLPMLAAGLAVMRRGAPSEPLLAGAVLGLMAGGITAGLYTLHCPEDSLLFVAAWHTPAVLVVSGLGALLGGRILHW